ncbi:MAG: DUF1475 family protein [Planctomycetota bacterium]|jgi:hypothetical protein
MRVAVILLVLGTAAMAAALLYGFTRGDGWTEVETLVAYPWFNVSLVDVYVGFALFGGWIVFRERSPLRAAGWIVLVLLLGNLVSCLYALLAVARSDGDWRRFWLGHRALSEASSHEYSRARPQFAE